MIRLIFLFLILLVLISFGASNFNPVTIKLLPFSIELKMPLFLLFYFSLGIGVIVGSLYYKFKK